MVFNLVWPLNLPPVVFDLQCAPLARQERLFLKALSCCTWSPSWIPGRFKCWGAAMSSFSWPEKTKQAVGRFPLSLIPQQPVSRQNNVPVTAEYRPNGPKFGCLDKQCKSLWARVSGSRDALSATVADSPTCIFITSRCCNNMCFPATS